MHEVQQDAGHHDRLKQPSGSPSLRPTPISLPKNRSTGNLHRNLSFTPLTARAEAGEESGPSARYRFSIDGSSLSERDAAILSPLMNEHDHGIGISGLRRIRQVVSSRAPSRAPSGTVSRTPTAPPSPETRYEPNLSRASSMNLHVSTGRGLSVDTAGPNGSFGEDLHRFPSESLHSFSFARQSEEVLHSRASVLKKSLEFMREKSGWGPGTQHPGLVMAQAKLSGDHDLQEIVSLLSKANVLEGDRSHFFGAITGPVTADNENIFDKFFAQRSTSPESLEDRTAPNSGAGQDHPQNQRQVYGIAENFTDSVNYSGHVAETVDDNPLQIVTSNDSDSRLLRRVTRPEISTRPGLRRTFTDTKTLSIQTQLSDALARPYNALDSGLDSALFLPATVPPFARNGLPLMTPGGSNHAAARWQPASQAIFTTGTSEPWTILAANDLACLLFGVTKAEIRKLGILEMIRSDRRDWLKMRLEAPGADAAIRAKSNVTSRSRNATAATSSNMAVAKGGITALLLSKPPARQQVLKRAQTEGQITRNSQRRGSATDGNKPRGVLLCGDILSIQKRNGATGSASLWVKEKKGYLIWVLEEIIEDAAELTLDESGKVLSASGATSAIWGQKDIDQGTHISKLLPKIPTLSPMRRMVDYRTIGDPGHLTARNGEGYGTPVIVTAKSHLGEINVSSFPHIAGIIVLSAVDMRITSSNSVFVRTLFGQPKANGLHVTDLIPQFVKLVDVLTEEGLFELADGVVVPEHSFRRARAHLAFREDASNAAETLFLRPTGLSAKHADGSEIFVDVQMRVVKSDSTVPEEAIIEEREEEGLQAGEAADEEESDHPASEMVYALWITYSRHLHSAGGGTKTPLVSRPATPPRQPSPGQAIAIIDDADDNESTRSDEDTEQTIKAGKPGGDVRSIEVLQSNDHSRIERDIKEATSSHISADVGKATVKIDPESAPDLEYKSTPPKSSAEAPSTKAPKRKNTINDFAIIEDMGQGAYGQVKLARFKEPPGNKVVLKYVTKKRILVDTWMRDRKLGTVPSEIHVLNFLKKDGMRHPNIIEMIDFFEDKDYYYIEMVPHGLPGMDLFDYIEMRPSMEEDEVWNIFVQVVSALHHLHTKAEVVHRDIKDENIILDGENRVKLIDFGSAAYTRNGPFDVFVGTIDYAAPEVITGQSYKGKPQDIWALGILLYTLIYKENPFYNVDEILERDLRVPTIMSEGSLALIRAMLNRDVDDRLTIEHVIDHPWTKGEGQGIGRRD